MDYDNEKVIVQISKFDLIENLKCLKNVSICLTEYSRGLGHIAKHPPQHYQIRRNSNEIYDFLSNLDKNSELCDRILVSTGVSFKSQLIQLGGDGYSSIHENLTQDKYRIPIDEAICKHLLGIFQALI